MLLPCNSVFSSLRVTYIKDSYEDQIMHYVKTISEKTQCTTHTEESEYYLGHMLSSQDELYFTEYELFGLLISPAFSFCSRNIGIITTSLRGFCEA